MSLADFPRFVRLLFPLALCIATGPLFHVESEAAKSNDPPNIILIMSDDMGFSDIGCYGGEINTPNLDQLAKNGLRFSQFYNTARCCPTRAALLSGVYQHQAGIGLMTGDKRLPGYRGELGRNVVSIAEALIAAMVIGAFSQIRRVASATTSSNSATGTTLLIKPIS